ncbi:hypothetical protein GCK32_007041 [Trichostrongylus colubriformis]|uniref:Uncharacterized protein n=1 Tax=Trichostrongylus colubriformis TaxID=6319 RepID=A0AAN8FXE2_TRICO
MFVYMCFFQVSSILEAAVHRIEMPSFHRDVVMYCKDFCSVVCATTESALEIGDRHIRVTTTETQIELRSKSSPTVWESFSNEVMEKVASLVAISFVLIIGFVIEGPEQKRSTDKRARNY